VSHFELGDLLVQELRHAHAPAGLWSRVEAGLDGRVTDRRIRISWVFASVALLVVICTLPFLHGNRELDLGSYLRPVQDASLMSSDEAIEQAPPHFKNVNGAGAASSVAGYQVSAQRVASVGGETVRQVILTAAGSAVALFISSPKVRLDAGANRWVDANVDGVACKRLNCPRVRTAQFACLEQTCVLICKACSDRALSALMSGVTEIR
jgi:hypothetical protein